MSSKCYNPFKKAYWTKDNLISQRGLDALNEIRESKSNNNILEKKVSGLGRKLTLGITVPLILTLILGPIGFAIGLIVAIGVFSKK